MKIAPQPWLMASLLLASTAAPAAPVYAPYVDMTLWPTPAVDEIGIRQGISQFTLAFVVNGSQPCTPSWGGVQDLGAGIASELLTGIAGSIENFRAKNGEIAISFGGANGLPLAQSCTSVSDLVNAYRTVIDLYSLSHVDFDIEGAAQLDAVSIERNFRAVRLLQKSAKSQGKVLHVSLTLPAMETGLTQAGIEVVASALRNRVAIDTVNLMTMDYGHAVADMGAAAMAAGQSLHTQIDTLYRSQGHPKTSRQLWRMVGITPMIGVNDTPDETFTLDHARAVSAFARKAPIGFLSMWSVGRDQACPGGPSPWASAVCSGIEQSEGAFAGILKKKTGHWGSGVIQDPEYGSDSGNGAEWSPTRIYVAGDTVTYNGATYRAKWWTQGEIPGQAEVWELVV